MLCFSSVSVNRYCSRRPSKHFFLQLSTDEGSPQLQLTKDQMHSIAEQVGSMWMKLGERLGLPADHLAYFKDTPDSEVERAVSMLTVWQVCLFSTHPFSALIKMWSFDQETYIHMNSHVMSCLYSCVYLTGGTHSQFQW